MLLYYYIIILLICSGISVCMYVCMYVWIYVCMRLFFFYLVGINRLQ